MGEWVSDSQLSARKQDILFLLQAGRVRRLAHAHGSWSAHSKGKPVEAITLSCSSTRRQSRRTAALDGNHVQLQHFAASSKVAG